MKKIFLLTLALLAGGFCANARAAQVQLLSLTPDGTLQDRAVPAVITAVFSEPMVALGAASDKLPCPFKVSPAIPGTCRWQDTRTAVFTPNNRFDYARRYEVAIPKGLKAVSGAELPDAIIRSFTTPLVSVLKSDPGDNAHWLSLTPTFFFAFNQEVKYGAVRGFITLAGSDGVKIPCGVRTAKPFEVEKLFPPYSVQEGDITPSTDTVLAVKPVLQLKPGMSYKLTLERGLPGQGGLGTEKARTFTFNTYGPQKFLDISASNVFSPASYAVRLSNPVKMADFIAHIIAPKGLKKTTPPNERGYGNNYGCGSDYNSCYSYNLDWWFEFEPAKTYAFTLTKGLTDVFGNVLPADVNFTVKTGNYAPFVSFTSGFGIMERALGPKHGYGTVNVPEVRYTQENIAPQNFITAYAKMQAANDVMTPPDDENKIKTTTHPVQDNFRLYGNINLSTATPFTLTGVYLPSRNMWAYALDNVTDIGITFKASPKNGVIWTSNLGKGTPLGRVNITLRDTANKVLWTGRTDGDGLAELPGWEALGIKTGSPWSAPAIWALAEKDGDTSALALDFDTGLEPWRFNMPSEYEKPAGKTRLLVFTDRGLYRPGETVSVKGFLRLYGKQGVTYTGIKTLTATLSRDYETIVSSFAVPVSERSSFDFTFPVPKTAEPGFWRINFTNPDPDGPSVDNGVNFSVEAFKRAQFAVSVTPLSRHYYPGETFTASVDGWYLAGAPMSGANVEWSLLLSPAPYAPGGLSSYTFTNADWVADRVIAAGKGKLDQNGRMTFTAAISTEALNRAYSLVAEASVLSPDMQRLFSRTSATLHPANFYIGVNGPWRVDTSTTPATASIITVRPEGTPAPGITVNAALTRSEYRNVARAGLSGRLEIVSEEKQIQISSFSFVSDMNAYVWTIPAGLAPGSYRLALNGAGPDGQKNSSGFTFYVPGQGETSWQRDNTDLLALTLDKTDYKPGDTARVMIKSPFEQAWALITVENESVVESRVELIKGGAQEIKIKLRDGYAPNVYVGVTLITGRTAPPTSSPLDMGKPKGKFGYARIPVSPAEHRLAVTLVASAKEYKPGAMATVSIRTASPDGDGVPAEVAFFAVDEGVLNLADYTLPSPMDEIYGVRMLGVRTTDSRPLVIGQRNFGEKGENRGGGGGAAGGVDIRSNFIPLAVWQPSVITDRKGRAEVSFKLPDTLTSYRLMAVAAAEARFGSSTDTIKVSKPLMLKAALPRFARKGDAFKAGAVLINYSSATVNATAELNLSGALAASAETKAVTLKPGEAKRLEWNFTAASTGTAELVFVARAGAETDGLRQTLEITQGELPETTAVTMAINKAGTQNLKRPANALAAEMSVTLSPTLMANLKLAAEYLAQYRYECLEQKLSKLAPLFVAPDFAKRWLGSSADGLDKQAQDLFGGLAAYKGPGGGFGYWENSYYSDPWLTAYALENYAAASRLGYKADPQVIKGALTYLASEVKNSADDNSAYALYALTLNDSLWPDAFTRLYDAREKLSGESLGYLLRAGVKLGVKQNQRTELSRMLLNRLNITGDAAFFSETGFSARAHGSAVKTTALCMLALTETDGSFSEADRAVRWLVRQQKNGRWQNTADNAAALRALEYYYSLNEKPGETFTASVSVPGAELMKTVFKDLTPAQSSATFNALELAPSTAPVPVRFEKTGEGRLYYTMALKTVPAMYKTPLDRGFSVKRSIKAQGGAKLTPGVRAEITVSIDTPQDRDFVVLEDFVPAGFEIVNQNLAGQTSANAADANTASADDYDYWRPGFNSVLRYDDRITAFADSLPAGHYEFTYLVQAVAEGEYGQPAGFVSCMYEPDLFGRTATGKVKILPAAK